MTVGIIFIICIILFITDRFTASAVAMAGCCALILTGACTPQAVFSGFSNDIVFIVFGTEIFGIACTESGLASIIAKAIKKFSATKGERKAATRIILFAGLIAAGLAILTPLSSGVIAMTMRIGYKFNDYIRYGLGLQLILTVSIIALTGFIYKV